MPPPITLQGGIPEVLGSTELEPYFQPENLDFNGLNKTDYLRTKKLPEGFYRFYAEVLDYNRGSVVSNKAMAIAFIVLNEPPLINLPLNNTKLPANDPQSILFNWAPRHLGSPNSAFTTLYEFRLYEIQPKGRNPYEAVRTTHPIYEAVPALTATSFNYNISMPSLIPGNEYAFTVRAVDREGRDLFKNDGYSEVYKFTWGDECKFPEGIKADTLPGGGIELKWKSAPAHTGYNISYKPAGSESWSNQNSLIDNASIYELPGNTVIQYKIQSICGGYFSDYSKVATIKTKEDEKRNFSCGSGNGLPAITNTTPKKTLNVGDIFTAGGYTAKVTKVSGQDGTFSGECNVAVPFFSLAKVPHKFENIKINELNQMYEGKLVSIYNPNSKFIADRKKGDENKQAEEKVADSNPTDTAITVQGEIKEVRSNNTGQLVIVSTTGDSTVIAPAEGEQVTITDSKGNEYKANNGSVEKTGSSEVTTGGSKVAQNNNTGTTGGTSSETTGNNTSIGKDHKAGDEVQFGPFKVKFNTAPINDETTSPGNCAYKVENISVDLSFEDEKIGLYRTTLTNASIKYTVDCASGNLLSASIDWSNNDGFLISGIGAIDALIKKASLAIDMSGKVSGSLSFEATLNKDKSIDNFVYIKKGVNGSFKFEFSATENSVSGSFNTEGVKDINIDLRNGTTVLASLSNGTVDSEGNLTGDFKLDQPVALVQDKTKLELKKFDANATVSILGDEIVFNSIDGEGSIKDLPGTKADLKVKIKDNNKKIVATATSQDNELFKFYGFSLGLEKLKIELSNKLDIQKIEGTDVTAAYAGTNDDGNITGNINISHFLIENSAIKDIKGSGSLAYPPYASITLDDGNYNQDKATLSFSANADMSSSTAKISTTVKDINIAADGTITLGTIQANLLATFGPLTIEFKTAPKVGKSDVKTAQAKVTIKIADAGVNEKVSFETSVEYKKATDGFTYLKADLSGLNYDFPDIYGIHTKITSASILYEKNNDQVNFAGKVNFSASLTEDKQLNPILKLRKGLSGNFAFNFDIASTGETSGSFDLTSLSGLNIDLIKGTKTIATLSGSIGKNGIISGRLKATENISYESSACTVTLNSLDLGATYDLKKSEFKIIDGSGKATISDIKGVTGSLVTEIEYKNENLNASIDKDNSKLSVCGMEISEMELDATIDSEFNFKKVSGNVTGKHPKFNAAFKVNDFLILDGELKSFKINGNIDYSGFKFTLTEANYKDEEFTCTAKVLLSDNFLKVDKFVLHKDGDITIGGCEGQIKKSDLVSIHFKASLTEDRFKGSFDAAIAKNIKVNGSVDMGSKQCSTCTYGAFSYGYYQLTIGAPIPIFPGVTMSKVGGQFGYNYALDFNTDPPKGSPTYGKYLAGLSFGIQDNAGMAELAIDPAVFQWGNESAELDLKGTLSIPKTSPIVKASATLKLKIPSYDISGNIAADVKIPGNTGKIFKANASCSFTFNSQVRDINVSNLSADVLGVLKFKGNFRNTQNFSKTGALTSSSGQLNGELSYALSTNFDYNIVIGSCTGNFKFNFAAGLNTAYNDQGLTSALIYGRVSSSGSMDFKFLGKSVFTPYYSIDASAALQKRPADWLLSANYNFVVGTQSLGSYTLNGNFSHVFN
jgi:hypothetical protein